MLRIDYKSGLPIYDQIYRGIVKMAAAGACLLYTSLLKKIATIKEREGIS